ncbi:MAG: RDD family protein, partial [Acidimicrobiaceae bacterium]|nr:RDD family protein [Acidimicrobiaceae bacterium]
GPRRRAAARAIDAAVTVVLALAAVMVAGLAAAFVTLYMHGFSGSDGALYGWLILFSLLALVPVARFEVTAIARRGQTLGKRTMGLRVVVWDEGVGAPVGGSGGVGAGRSIERWAVPHGAGLLAGVVAGAASAPWIGAYGLLVGAAMWLVVSAVIYLSALGDPHGRGWHDKAAGTIVIKAPRPYRSAQGPEIPQKWQGWRDVPFS